MASSLFLRGYHCHMRTTCDTTLIKKHWMLKSIDAAESITCHCHKCIKGWQMSAFYSQTVSFDYCRSVLVSCIMRYRCSLHRKCYHLFLYCISCVYLLLAHLPLPGMSCLSHSNSQRPLHLQRLRKSWRRWLSLEQVASFITLRPCCMFWNVSTTVFRFFLFSSLVHVNFTPVKNVRGIPLSKLIYQSEHFVCVFFCQTSRTASTFFGGNLDEKILRWWLCLKYKAGTQPSSA